MKTPQPGLTRRHYLAASGASVLAAGLSRPAWALETVRQGYQTNIWGMPTYYLMRSGLLEKHGVKFEEFAVPSGNLTMQQMVARQVDVGTYAGQSLILGNAKGGLSAIALIEYVGKTGRVVARADLGITKLEQLKGMKIANQVGSSIASVFTDTIGPQHGLKKGDYQEVRMDVNNMIAALAAKTVDAMVNVEPYNVIAVADGLGVDLIDFSSVDRMPVFMAATPDFIEKSPETVVAYLKAWLDVARDFKENPKKVADVIYSFYTDKGYKMSIDSFKTALARVEVDPGFPSDLKPYMQEQAEILLREKKINAIPDWSKALRPDFMQKARAAT
ncbi:MAG TPA: ABC transporter substrate-binding protein [Xanthobacteraceae bacterium]|jgi:NitT/TauT family transport system substrate-binding protein|nr:ABC transporter substrate-binding protein [Xanthobacteraceae bacterium]